MPLVRFRQNGERTPAIGILRDDLVVPLPASSGMTSMVELLQHRAAEIASATAAVDDADGVSASDVTFLAPLDVQETWACGVTYKRSRDARMEESQQRDVYDMVYEAERPELFFKATPSRVAEPGGSVMIRSDSTWDVPEPELTLVINRHAEIVGYTIGNDMSSRSIEGENPLYLPQAKVYAGCASVGPVVALAGEMDPANATISLMIERDDAEQFSGSISTSDINRPFDELVAYLHRGNRFPDGVLLMTGTGIVPPESFTLQAGDVVRITIDGIGTLVNRVARLDVSAL